VSADTVEATAAFLIMLSIKLEATWLVYAAVLLTGIAYPWGFYAFAIAAVLAMVALATVPARPGSGGWKMTGWPATPPPLGQASPRAHWHSSARSTRSTDGSR